MKKYMKLICCVFAMVLVFGVVGAGLSAEDGLVTVANAIRTEGPYGTGDPYGTDAPASESPDTDRSTVPVLSGNDQNVRAGDAVSIRFDREVSTFSSAYMDGVAMSSGDYTVKSGSTIITVPGAYTKKLAPGLHTLSADFTDGMTGIAYFTIDGGTTSPKTGDMGVVLYAALAGMGAIGSTAWFCKRKKVND